MKAFIVLICLSLFSVVAMAQSQGISISTYLRQLAVENNIEVVGMSAVGGDTFAPFSRQRDVDKSIARALSRYNYIVNYGDHQRIVRVVILGKKGSSVGALPEDMPEPPPVEDPNPQE